MASHHVNSFLVLRLFKEPKKAVLDLHELISKARFGGVNHIQNALAGIRAMLILVLTATSWRRESLFVCLRLTTAIFCAIPSPRRSLRTQGRGGIVADAMLVVVVANNDEVDRVGVQRHAPVAAGIIYILMDPSN
jgi:hypothetical protein